MLDIFFIKCEQFLLNEINFASEVLLGFIQTLYQFMIIDPKPLKTGTSVDLNLVS